MKAPCGHQQAFDPMRVADLKAAARACVEARTLASHLLIFVFVAVSVQ
jgi:hypothetical protein